MFQHAARRHLRAVDVYRTLIEQGSDIGIPTVYRVLAQLEQAGLLSRVHFETGKPLFDLREGRHHDHLVCVRCGRVEEFYDAQIEERQCEVARKHGFDLRSHGLVLYGLFANCACREPKRPA